MRHVRGWTALVLLAGGVLCGQEFRATLNGAVRDPAGASIPAANLILTNSDTGERFRGATDATGNYTFALVRPGNYEIQVESAGFRKYVRKGLTLSVNQSATLDVVMQIGEGTETVTVTAETPLLDTATADRGGVIDQKVISEMPLNGRNPFMLSMLVPGVNYNGSLAYMHPFDNGAIADWGISGGDNRSNEFLMDGVPNNAQAGGNNIAYVPPVDSVQEFKIQTNSYDAQYGKHRAAW